MNDKHLVNSLPYILGVVAAGTGVQIRTDPHASTASTNGKVIFFPPLPYKGDELAVYSLGYLVHEAGHIRSSDFEAFVEASKTPLHKMLINVLEDVRIERLINGVFPGARTWLDGLTQKFVETKRQGVVDPDADLVLCLIRYLQDWLFESVLGYSSVKGIGTQQRDLWRSKVSPELADQIEKLALAAAWATSTSLVIAAAGEIISLLKQEQESSAQQAQQSQDSSQGDTSEQGDADDQDSQQSDDGDGSGSDDSTDQQQAGDGGQQGGDADADPDAGGQPGPSGSADDPGDASSDTATDADGDPTQDGSGQSASTSLGDNSVNGQKPASKKSASGADTDSSQSEGSPKGEKQSSNSQDVAQTDPQTYADALNALLETAELDQGADRGDAIKQDMEGAVGTSQARQDSTFTLPRVTPTLKGGGDADAIGRVKAASIALRYRMEEFLEAKMKTRRRAADSGKRLVHDAGRRLALGDFRVFEKRTQGQKIDTAVHVLVDISSSMLRDSRHKVAIDSSLALGVALQDIDGVIFSMSAFPFHGHDVVDVVMPGELIRDVAARAPLMVPNGSTPLDKGLLHAHTALMTVKAGRRVCLVVTDGEPDDLEAVRLLIEMGKGDGIEYLGIGIASSAAHITPNACQVNDLADLPKQVIAMMQDVILLPLAA